MEGEKKGHGNETVVLTLQLTCFGVKTNGLVKKRGKERLKEKTKDAGNIDAGEKFGKDEMEAKDNRKSEGKKGRTRQG